MFQAGDIAVADFNGGTGPLNRQLATWRAQGWSVVSATRQSGNRWDVVLRCGEL